MEGKNTSGTQVRSANLYRIRTADPEPIVQMTRQGNTAFPTVGILKRTKSRKKKATW